MKRHRLAFPISTETRDRDGAVFQHEVVGGLSIRDYVAIEFAAAMFSNPALPAHSIVDSQIRAAAIKQADAFIAMLGEE